MSKVQKAFPGFRRKGLFLRRIPGALFLFFLGLFLLGLPGGFLRLAGRFFFLAGGLFLGAGTLLLQVALEDAALFLRLLFQLLQDTELLLAFFLQRFLALGFLLFLVFLILFRVLRIPFSLLLGSDTGLLGLASRLFRLAGGLLFCLPGLFKVPGRRLLGGLFRLLLRLVDLVMARESAGGVFLSESRVGVVPASESSSPSRTSSAAERTGGVAVVSTAVDVVSAGTGAVSFGFGATGFSLGCRAFTTAIESR